MANKVTRVVRRVFATLLAVALVAAAAFAYLHRQEINDHFAAHNFDASASVLALTDRIFLTEAGRRVFLASEPTLEASQHFNEQCDAVDHSEGSHVLGCYADGKIHLFEVSDERLNGIVEVTATHELLHAVFDRLGTNERADLSKRLHRLFEDLAGENEVLAERMSVYANLPKTAFANELHSVLGTELRALPDWLEDHYAKWLADRGAIIDYFDSYHSVFAELHARAEALQEEMAALRADVERRSAAYDAAVHLFNEEWHEFVRRNEAYEFSEDPDEFYRIRDDFYARRDALSAEVNSLNADIARYEEMRTELLALSELTHELEQLLDSELAPPSNTPVDDL